MFKFSLMAFTCKIFVYILYFIPLRKISLTFLQNTLMKIYDTLLQALNDLKLRGFTTDFNIAFDNVQCAATGTCLNPSQFEIVEHYRFEGKNDPDDSSVLYAISAKDGSLKGVLVNAYGVYGDAASDELIKKLAINE